MKIKSIIKFTSVSIIFIFLFAYFTEMSGYYEYSLANKKNLTDEQIKQFENDIRDGKNIDITTYQKSNTTDYSNNLTKTTSETNIKLNNYLKKVIENTLQTLKKLVE